MVPSPDPDAPLVIVSHGASLWACQAQPAATRMSTPPRAPLASNVRSPPFSLEVQPMPACVIVKLWLATTTIAVRCAGDVLAATVNCTLPSARPSRALSVTKVSLDVANHVHSAPAVTLTVPVPPPAGTLVPVAVAEYEQGGGAFGGAAPTWIPEVSGV